MAETPLTDSIEALTIYANQTTGASDTNLSDAVYTLVQGYGQGVTYTDGNWGIPYTKNFVVGEMSGEWGRYSYTNSPFGHMTHLESVIVNATGIWGSGTNVKTGTFLGCTALKSISFPCLSGFSSRGYNEDQIAGCMNLEEFIIGSVGHPVTEMGTTSGSYQIFRNNTASFTITVYVDAESLSDVPSSLISGQPWGATNATVIYRSSNTGEILT